MVRRDRRIVLVEAVGNAVDQYGQYISCWMYSSRVRTTLTGPSTCLAISTARTAPLLSSRRPTRRRSDSRHAATPRSETRPPFRLVDPVLDQTRRPLATRLVQLWYCGRTIAHPGARAPTSWALPITMRRSSCRRRPMASCAGWRRQARSRATSRRACCQTSPPASGVGRCSFRRRAGRAGGGPYEEKKSKNNKVGNPATEYWRDFRNPLSA
jgi:hypothetical protein